jgi:GT2 family glycosyltransferase
MIGVVVVSYHSDDLTVRFVRDQLGRITLPCRIVVVDNGATAQEAEALQQRIPEAVVLPAENKGFAVGNNIGIRYLLEHGRPDRILLANNDVVFVTERVVETLAEVLDTHPDVGIVGPEVVGPDGRRQGPEPYQGMWKRYFWMYVSTPFLSRKAKRRLFDLDYAEQAAEGRHDKLVGAFMLADTDALVQAGLFDEGTFLYAEENILSDRMAAIGKYCWFCPSVRVLHDHGQTVGRNFSTRRQDLLQWESMSYYYRKYRGYSAFSVRVLSVLFRMILSVK